MITCPFCRTDKENVTPRRIQLPIPGQVRPLFATSKEPMCDECFQKMSETFKGQGDDITKGT